MSKDTEKPNGFSAQDLIVAEEQFNKLRIKYGTPDDAETMRVIYYLCRELEKAYGVRTSPFEIHQLLLNGMSLKEIIDFVASYKDSTATAIYRLASAITDAQSDNANAEDKRTRENRLAAEELDARQRVHQAALAQRQEVQQGADRQVREKELELQRQQMYMETRALPFAEQLRRWSVDQIIYFDNIEGYTLHKENAFAFIKSAKTKEEMMDLLRWFLFVAELDRKDSKYKTYAERIRNKLFILLHYQFLTEVRSLQEAIDQLSEIPDLLVDVKSS